MQDLPRSVWDFPTRQSWSPEWEVQNAIFLKQLTKNIGVSPLTPLPLHEVTAVDIKMMELIDRFWNELLIW
jgi:hypothetical protein